MLFFSIEFAKVVYHHRAKDCMYVLYLKKVSYNHLFLRIVSPLTLHDTNGLSNDFM